MPFRLQTGAEPIPGYKLMERLGGGGFGEVWKVEAPGGLLKAMKFVYGDLATASPDGQRAEQELKSLSRVKTVRHPYILTLERFDVLDGQLVIVMELADRNLWDRFRECRNQGLPGIPREELLHYMEETAEALDLMNGQYQLQHLDIKPQNIFLVHNHVKVADFGLVKDLQGVTATVTGGVTPVYAAPETFDGLVSRFCDQYSLAIVYQELLTGHRPFVGTNVHQLIMQHVQGKPNLASLPTEDQEAIGRALAKSPDQRHPSCMDLIRALKTGAIPVRNEPVLVRQRVPSAEEDATVDLSPPRGDRRVAHDEGRVQESAVVSSEITAVAQPFVSFLAPPPPPPPPILAVPFVSQPAALASVFSQVGPDSEPLAALPPVASAPTERQGNGELFPALVIGVGQMGLKVILNLREELREGFGSPDVLPQLRFLYLDTDPETLAGTTPPGRDPLLPQSDMLLARLNRAIHYQKPRDGRPPLESWLNPNLLYRIPRNLTTDGLRALGRLALVDNYRAIAQRLRAELEACTEPEALTTASQKTGLEMRGNRPRVYLAAGLGGGTGGGIFIDLAYVVRHLLKQLGYATPDVVGLLLLPKADTAGSSRGLVNAVASLIELNHFSNPDVTFSARFDEREGTLRDAAAPFSRCVLLPEEGPADGEQGSASRIQEPASKAADFLYRDLTTQLGRVADASRRKKLGEGQEAREERGEGKGERGKPAVPNSSSLPPAPCPLSPLSSFGLFRLFWPRRALLQRAARRYCQQVVQHWTSSACAAGHEAVQSWVKDQWANHEFGADFLIERFKQACARDLGGMEPERAIANLTEPLVPKGWWNPQLDLNAVGGALNQLADMLGQPVGLMTRPGLLEATLQRVTEPLVAEWQHQLSELLFQLVDDPNYRLGGAEQALTDFLHLIDHALAAHDPLNQELAANATRLFERLNVLLPSLHQLAKGGRTNSKFKDEVVELIRDYPKWRYQSLILKHVAATYSALRVHVAEQLREVAFCRSRLSDLVRAFGMVPSFDSDDLELGVDPCLFPAGCQNLDDAVERFFPMAELGELVELDRRLQVMIAQQFQGLWHVCMASSNLLMRNLELAMQAEAEAALDPSLAGTNVMEMFLRRYSHPEGARGDLSTAFAAAAPPGGGPTASASEISILAVPPGPGEDRLRDLAQRAMPGVELVQAASADDIVFYREEPNVALASLEHLGPEAREVYRQALATEHASPHSRGDIAEWREIKRDEG